MKKDLIIENASTRDSERIIKNKTAPSAADILFFKSSSDIGTIRNAGRRGSNFAPEAIINIVKKLALHNEQTWSEIEIAKPALELESFEYAQKEYSVTLATALQSYPKASKFIYLGGGHDHVYPLLKALNTKSKKIKVINIDAHLDTRVDEFSNSGTPFRQFANEFEGQFELIQLGIHDFANSKTSMNELGSAKEVVATYDDLRHLTNNFTNNRKTFERMIPYDHEALYLFSLDADALDSGIMEGVSAVNHRGLPYHFVEELLIYAQDVLRVKHYGFYEYNPVYDNLSQKGARTLAGLIYKIMDH
ncbi:MAG: arginase family protein [Bacteriovorax sp.]|nr:arginase family protein [Bacteriovorax sp.]